MEMENAPIIPSFVIPSFVDEHGGSWKSCEVKAHGDSGCKAN